MTNKVAFITGASRGMGHAVALDLAKQKYDLFLVARSHDALTELAKECEKNGIKVVVCAGDVSDKAFVEQAVATCKQQLETIHVAFLNQGISSRDAFMRSNEWEAIIDVNLKASMYLTQLLLPYLIENDQAQRALIFTGSIASRLSSKNAAAYAASKHGLIGFAQSIFEEVREHNIKVSVICPGFVNTAILKHRQGLETSKMIQTQDIVDTVNYILQSSAQVCPTEIILRPQRTPYK